MPMKVQRCYIELLESGGRWGGQLAPKTVRHAHVVLRKALADAERMQVVTRNAAAAARPPPGEHTEMTTWLSEDLRDFFTEVVMGPPKSANSRRNVYLDRRTVTALRNANASSASPPVAGRRRRGDGKPGAASGSGRDVASGRWEAAFGSFRVAAGTADR